MPRDPIQFVDDDPNLAYTQAKGYYESISKRTLNEGDPEMLLINTLGYMVSLVRGDLNHTGNQNLVNYSSGAALEELGAPFDTFKLDARGAESVIEYTLQTGHTGVFIPKGNRVKSDDGKVIFETTVDTNVPAGQTLISIISECTTTGAAGNDYAIGKINTILDPIAQVLGASNVTVSTGGADEETEDEFAERLTKASAKFSVAGPEDAYIYWAKTAHPLIVDVKTTSPSPVHVNIYPLLKDGQIPDTTILTAVQNICSQKDIRPQTDVVAALAPTKLDYNINISLILRKNAVPGTLQKAIDAVTAFVEDRKNKLGMDVVREQISGVVMADKDNIYKPIINNPIADIPAQPYEYTNCTGITITVQSIADE